MQNRDEPATAILIDNGVDEPTQHTGLTKLEWAAIQIYASNPKPGIPSSVRAAHELFDKVNMARACLNEPDKFAEFDEPKSTSKPPEKEPSYERRDPDND